MLRRLGRFNYCCRFTTRERGSLGKKKRLSWLFFFNVVAFVCLSCGFLPNPRSAHSAIHHHAKRFQIGLVILSHHSCRLPLLFNGLLLVCGSLFSRFGSRVSADKSPVLEGRPMDGWTDGDVHTLMSLTRGAVILICGLSDERASS